MLHVALVTLIPEAVQGAEPWTALKMLHVALDTLIPEAVQGAEFLIVFKISQ